MSALSTRIADQLRRELPVEVTQIQIAPGRAAATVRLAWNAHPSRITPALAVATGRVAATSLQRDGDVVRNAIAVSLVVRFPPSALRRTAPGGQVTARALVVGCDAFHLSVQVGVEDERGAPIAHATLLASLTGEVLSGHAPAHCRRTVWPN